jgi:redox-sensitive bicupin YhaK (pirin superfamily)
MTMQGRTKFVLRVFGSSSPHWVGDGFRVHTLFPASGLDMEMDPFLLLDYASPMRFEPTNEERGVGEHPHLGFETVTFIYQGSLEHRDSAGQAGRLGPGDVQWMTAGSGIVHEEKHDEDFRKQGGMFEMVQLWVNLPRAHKFTGPRYQTLRAQDIPMGRFAEDAGEVRVIAGDWNGLSGPAETVTPIQIYDVVVKAGRTAEIELKNGYNSAALLRKGNVKVNGAAMEGEALLALFDTRGERVVFEAKEESELLILSAQPIGEPVASYGPFVMNTQDELRQAIEDYRAGKMGTLT